MMYVAIATVIFSRAKITCYLHKVKIACLPACIAGAYFKDRHVHEERGVPLPFSITTIQN